MNGYKFQADAYRAYLQQNEVQEETKSCIERKIKALDIIADLSDEDVLDLYNTGAFNSITLGYAEKAMKSLKLPKGRREDVLSAIRYMHDTMGAEEAVS